MMPFTVDSDPDDIKREIERQKRLFDKKWLRHNLNPRHRARLQTAWENFLRDIAPLFSVMKEARKQRAKREWEAVGIYDLDE